MSSRRRRTTALLLAAALAAGGVGRVRAQTAPPAPLGTTQIRVLGLAVDLDTRPDLPGLQTTMTAVKDIPTGVETFLGSRVDLAARTQLPGALVKAELSGPSLGALRIEVSAPGNALMELPLLRAAGKHLLSNVRLEDASGQLLLARDPTLAPIEIDVIDELLVTSVTSRALTLDEIREKGIVIDATNFQVRSFVVGLTLGSEKVTIDLPVAIPVTSQALAELETPQFTSLPFFEDELRKINIPNFSLSGFSMRAPPEVEQKDRQLIPAIEGVVVIPGNVAFLNQFFSVVLQATNVAPGGSGLVLRGAQATVALPTGGDDISGTGDDPLRMAVLASGPQPTTQPLADDAGADAIQPQGTNHAEYLVEGLREGTHLLDFGLRGELFVPALGRTVAMTGVAKGVVQVKNPTFSVVLAHPRVVRDGEPYALFATVTNTSSIPANLFQVELAGRSLSGTSMAAGETTKRQVDTLAAGESASFEWRLVSRSTGEVTGTVFLAQEGVNGSFVLTHGVGDTGIPLSPDTLVLPQITNAIPSDPPLVPAAVRMLGQAYSVATAPGGTLPPAVARIGKPFVIDRAVRVAQVGLHVRLGEPLAASAQELLLDWLGNDRARLATLFPDATARQNTESDLRAFDALRRAAGAGENFTNVVGQVLAAGLAGRPATGLPAELGARFASRPGFIAFGASARGAPVELELRDARGGRLGRLDPNAPRAREIPFAAQIPLARSADAGDELVLVASPEPEAYTLALAAPVAAAGVDLTALVADLSGLVVATWPRVDLVAGATARVGVRPDAANLFVLEIDDDADGIADRSVIPARVDPIGDAPPALVAAHQWAKGAQPNVRPSFESGDPLGRLVAVLFDEEVEKAAAEDPASYALPANRVLSASLQPDRRSVFVVTEQPVGPFVARALTASVISDVRGHVLATSTRGIQGDPERGLAGRVSGSVVSVDGRPVPFARVQYIQPIDQKSLFDCFPQDFVVSTLAADASGRFEIDFVLQNGFSPERICNGDRWLNVRNAGATNHFKLEAEDPQTGDLAKLSTRIQFDAQHMSVQLVSRGLASLEGIVFDEAGVPIPGGDPGTPESLQILATNLSTGELAVSWIDAAGRYGFPRSFTAQGGTKTEVPQLAVGNVALLVVRPADGFTGVATANLPAAGARVVQDVVMSAPFRFGTVSGVVLEVDGRTPAPNVVVELAGQALTSFGLAGRTSGKARLASATTDAAGRFSFASVPAGDIEVAATRQATFEQVRASSAVAGGLDTPVQLVLPGGGGSVRGIVRDAFGNLVPNALVAGGPTLTATDANGFFEIRGLPRGTFSISSRTVDSPALGRVSVTTRRPDDVQDVVVTLEPVGTIGGTLLEADGVTPIVAQKVQLWFEESAVAAETFTAADGSYLFAGYPAGKYSVRAIRESDADGGTALTEIRFAGDVRDVDFAFRGLGEISGRVIQDNGTPAIADVLVQHKRWMIVRDTGLVDNAALGLAILQQFAQIPGLAELVGRTIVDNGLDQPSNEFFLLVDDVIALRSDALGPGGQVTGRFLASGPITGGPFTVAAFGPFLAPAEVSGEIPRTTDPAARRVDVGDIVLAPTTGAIRGTVFLPDGVTPVGENVRVKVRSLGTSGEVKTIVGTQTQPVLPEIDVVTDPDGRFEFPLVLRGSVIVTADTGVPDPLVAARSAAEIRTDVFADAQGQRVLNVRLFGQAKGAVPKLALGEFVTLDVRLEDVAGTRVRVVESDGTTAVAGARVQVATGSTLDADPAAAFTDTNGEVDFFPLPEGSFSVSVSVPGRPQRGGAAGIVPVDAPNGLELPITVKLGAVTTASGQIVSAPIFGSVEGLVRRADGTPNANPAEVTVSAGGISIVSTSGPDGRYRADNVPGGFFAVSVFEPFTARRGAASGALTSDGQTVTADVTLVGLGNVSGSVSASDGTRSVPNVDVTLFPSGDFTDRLVTRTDAQGLYTLPGVPLGTYRVEARDFQTGLTGQSSGSLVRDGENATTDVTLQASGGITGILYAPGVLLDANGQPVNPDGSPRPAAPVASGVEVAIAGPRTQTVQTRADGSFVSAGFLPLGDYALTARSATSDDGATGRASVRFDAEIAFAALVLRGIGRVEGVVLDPLGAAPVASASVTLASASPFARGATTRISGPDGRFAFDDVAVGELSLSVRENLQIPALGGAAQGEILRHGDTIVFEDGDADPQHEAIRLQAAGDVVGRAVLSDGATAALGAVVLLDGNGLRVTRVADASGGFRYDGIPLGTYALSVREPRTNGVASASIALQTNGQAIDVGVLVLDSTAPLLVSSQPAASTSGVDPATPVLLRFSEAIDPASVDAETVVVTIAGAAVAGSFAVTGLEVVFTPAARLPDLANVDVRIRADVLDFEGRVSFAGIRDLAGRSPALDAALTFTTADSTGPSVVSISPPPGAIEVDPRAVLRIELSEAIDRASLTGLTLRDASGALVAGAVNTTPILGDRVLVFSPAQRLAANDTITWRLDGPLRDRAGNAMAQASLGGSFATVDSLAPVLAFLGFPPGARLVTGRAVVATADLAQAEAGASVELYVNGALVATDVSAPFESALLLTPGLGSQVTLAAVALDAVGNRSPQRTASFAIAPNAPPVVRLVAPASGAVSQGALVSVEVEADDDVGVSELRFSVDDGAIAAAAQPGGAAENVRASFSFRVPTSLPAGRTLSVRAAATDVLGLGANSGTAVTLTVGDNAAPAIAFTSPAPGSALEPGAAATIIVRADDASGVTSLRLQAPSLGFDETRSFAAGTSPATASFSVAVPPGTAPGNLNVSAQATDSGGNTASRVLALRVADRRAPAASVSAPSAFAEPGRQAVVDVTASDEIGVVRIEVALGNAPAETRTFVSTTQTTQRFSLDVPAGTALGSILAVTARAFDAAGNASPPATLTLTSADVTAPDVSIATPADGALVAPGASVPIEVLALDAFGVARIAFVATGAAPGAGELRFAPPGAAASASFVLDVPAGASAGAPITLDVTADDAAGNAAPPRQVRLTVADVVALRVLSLDPADGAADVAPDAVMRVTFDEPVDPASVSAASLRLVCAGADVAGSFGFASGGRLVTFTPVAPLADGMLCALSVAGVRDLAGNALAAPVASSFTTRGADATPPAVESVSPPDGASGVAPGAAVFLGFSEALDPASVTFLSVALERGDGTPVLAQLALSGDRRTLTLTPTARLDLATLYRVRLPAGGVQDASGNALAADFTSTFTSQQPDVSGPRFLFVDPPDGATGVSVFPLLRACFDDGLDGASLLASGAVRLVAVAGGAELPLALRLDGSGRCLEATPAAALALEAVHELQLSGALRGSDGNPVLASDGGPFTAFASRFTTGAFAIVEPPAGAVAIENTTLAVEASGGASVGFAAVRFAANGVDVATISAPPFRTVVSVPPASSALRLEIVATALDASGNAVASDARSLPIVVGLRFERALSGLPVGQSSALRLLASSPSPTDLTVVVTAHDPALVGIASAVLVLPAGARELGVPVEGLAEGATAVLATSLQGVTSTIVAVSPALAPPVFSSPPAPDATPPVLASPVGVTVEAFPSVGVVVLPVGASRTLRIRLLETPAGVTTPVLATSSNPAVADLAAAASVAAGSTDATLTLAAGAAGETVLVLRAGSEGRELRVIVGAARADQTFVVVAPPVGVLVLALPSAGLVIVAPGSSATVTVPVLATPSAVDTLLTVSSSDAAVATVTGPVVVPAGSTDVTLSIAGGAPGEALLTLRNGREGRELRVAVGAPAPGAVPPVVAPPVGVVVLPAVSLGDVVVAQGSVPTLTLRVLDAAQASDTVFEVRSSDPSIARIDGNVVVPAGATDASLALVIGAAGEALLELRELGSVRGGRTLRVTVGTPAPDRVPTITAAPVGVAVLEAGTSGTLFLGSGGSRTLTLDVLPIPLPVDLQVSVTSRDLGVARVSPATATIPAGARSVSIRVDAIASGDAETIVDLVAGAERRTLVVVVGKPPAAKAPLTLAPPVGACVDDSLAPPARRCPPLP